MSGNYEQVFILRLKFSKGFINKDYLLNIMGFSFYDFVNALVIILEFVLGTIMYLFIISHDGKNIILRLLRNIVIAVFGVGPVVFVVILSVYMLLYDREAFLGYLIYIYLLIVVTILFGVIFCNDPILHIKSRFVRFAMVMLGLAIIILVAQSTIILNDEQKNFAEKAAQVSLRNDKLCDICEVSVSSFGYIKHTENGDQKIAEVTFTQGETIIFLGIDLDNGTVVEKRQTTKAQVAYDSAPV